MGLLYLYLYFYIQSVEVLTIVELILGL
jgi:hypothetical protein